ncbi:MAG: peptidylprolyl isomerase [Burkholderiaceae bacterium]|nr:peptidylprolyl isomerase [Burkholderiaceae bacterium]
MEEMQGNAVKVVCETTKGSIDIVVEPDWSPHGAARFLQLIDDGHFDNLPLFRCVAGFLCQFGAVPPRPNAKTYLTIPDDPKLPHLRHFRRGYLSFAGNGEHSRATHMFITLGDNLDALGSMPWETPFGYVTDASMQNTVSRFSTEYGDIPPWGTGPDPQKIEAEHGGWYLKLGFPALDYITSCRRA